MLSVTQRYIQDGKVVKEETYPAAIDKIGCPPFRMTGAGSAEISVEFEFKPPLVVPKPKVG